MDKIKIDYYDNNLNLHNIPSNKHRLIPRLWASVRHDYSYWVANFKLKTLINDKSIEEGLRWKGMSSWWLNQLTTKDVEVNNAWINRIMILYLCREFSCEIYTNDKILIKSLGKNSKNLNSYCVYRSSFFKGYFVGCIHVIQILFSIFKCIKFSFLLMGMKKIQENLILKTNPSVWFRSAYPANWIARKDGGVEDRHLKGAPLLDQEFGQTSGYLTSLITYKKTSLVSLWKEVRFLSTKSKRTVIFTEVYLKLTDYIEVYYSTFVEYLKFSKWKKNSIFLNLFYIDNLDMSGILIDLWKESYFSRMQNNKLISLSIVRFAENFNNDKLIVTYEEFLPHTRYAYSNSKEPNKVNTYIALQHAYNCKSKMHFYFQSNELNCDDENLRLPAPDYYLIQGPQFKSLLESFYDKDKIRVIGCLKYDNFSNIESNAFEIKKRIVDKYHLENKRVILLAPSVNDIDSILNIVSSLKNHSNVEILLSPHPATDINKMKDSNNSICPELKIRFVTEEKTEELLTVASIVICGYSSVVLEASFFGVQPIRALPLGGIPLFDDDNLIPCFYSSEDFIDWYKNFTDTDLNRHQLRLLPEKYFYKIDGQSSVRLWDSILKIKKTNAA